MIAVATEELGKICSRVQPVKFPCIVSPDTALEPAEVIRAKVPVVTGTSALTKSPFGNGLVDDG
jgi:hypothetical protein